MFEINSIFNKKLKFKFVFVFLVIWVLTSNGCTESSKSAQEEVKQIPAPKIEDYKEVEWTELLPADDLDAILNPPAYITDVVDGSIEDQIASQIESAFGIDENDPYQRALTSTRVLEELDGTLIKLPGFIVPLNYDENQKITEFFIVPYFGACIHVPPPPPNQIIYVNYPEGFDLDNWSLPFWFLGKLKTTLIENEMATSAYSLDIEKIEVYDEY